MQPVTTGNLTNNPAKPIRLREKPLALARQYQAMLGNVIPQDATKKPLTPWKKWTLQRQTDADRAAMPWSRARGIAVVVGALSDGLLVVDFDKQPDRAALDAFLTALKLPSDYAWIVQTPGGLYGLQIPLVRLSAISCWRSSFTVMRSSK